jgi:hypothetical protein
VVLHDALWLVILGVVIEEWKLLKHLATFTRYSFSGRFREALSKAWKHKGEIVEGAGFSILVIGLAGELALAPLIETLQKTELQTQKKQTADALQKAGELGVDVNNLHTFVDGKEKVIGEQMDTFNKFAANQKLQTDGVIVALNTDRAKLDEATAKALAAAKESEQILERLNAALKPREFSPAQEFLFVSHLLRFRNTTAGIWRGEATSPDTFPFALSLLKLLDKSLWAARGVSVSHGSYGTGVVVEKRADASSSAGRSADALVAELQTDGIPATRGPDFKDETALQGGMSENVYQGPPPDILVFVGSK